MKGGGLILLSTHKENKKIMDAYRQIEKNFKWDGEDTPIDISYLQHLFIHKNNPNNPYVLYTFIDNIRTDTYIIDSRNKLKIWLTKENIENLEKDLGNFINRFKKSIDKLYSSWGN
jgi:hypothetical protein